MRRRRPAVVSPRAAGFGALGLGALAVGAATLLGSTAGALDAVVLLTRALTRLAGGATDVPGMVRGVRLLFLARAAAVAGVGWVVGEALPLIVALVVAGIDVVETSFLLIVVGSASRSDGADPGP